MSSFSGNLAAAVLLEAAVMTDPEELETKRHTSADAHICTEPEEKQGEKSLKEKDENEGERDVKRMEDGGNEAREKVEKKESLPEESLRMTSWVEVGCDRPVTEGNCEAEPDLTERARDGAEEQRLLEADGRSPEEAEKEQTLSVEAELAMIEEKWREQCAINETLRQRLADEEERFRVGHLTQTD